LERISVLSWCNPEQGARPMSRWLLEISKEETPQAHGSLCFLSEGKKSHYFLPKG